MSYMSGFMLGTALGENLNKLVSSNFYGRFKAKQPRFTDIRPVSIQKGRRRYRVGKLSPKLAMALEEKLPKLGFIKEVHANPQTGSLLLLHKGTEKQMDDLAFYLKRFIFNNTTSKGLRTHTKEGNITRSIQGYAGRLSKWLKRRSKNNLDLTSAASFLFIALGIRKLVALRQFPTGPQMLWWAVSLLRGRHD